MIQLHPEILRKNGKDEFVVLPFEEYVALKELLEDAEDILELRSAKSKAAGRPTTPLKDVMKRFGLKS